MSNYYYLISALPPLEYPVLPEGIDSARIRSYFQVNLSEEDYKKVRSLYLLVDLLNVKTLFREEEIDSRGNLNEEELDEALLHGDFFPEYVFDFLQKHETLADRIKYFPSLLALFFHEETNKETGFLRSYFSFERELRLVLLAIRAKVLGRDLLQELQFEDLTDPLVLQILSQKDAETYDPPSEYKEVNELLAAAGSDPLKQSTAIASYRFRKVREMGEGEDFSIDALLRYLTELMIIEYSNELNKEKGQIILSTFKKSER